MNWARILAYITGTVDQDCCCERVLGCREPDFEIAAQRALAAVSATLGEIGHRLGRKALADVANAARPDTILG